MLLSSFKIYFQLLLSSATWCCAFNNDSTLQWNRFHSKIYIFKKNWLWLKLSCACASECVVACRTGALWLPSTKAGRTSPIRGRSFLYCSGWGLCWFNLGSVALPQQTQLFFGLLPWLTFVVIHLVWNCMKGNSLYIALKCFESYTQEV